MLQAGYSILVIRSPSCSLNHPDTCLRAFLLDIPPVQKAITSRTCKFCFLANFSSESFYLLKVATTHDISPDTPNTLLHLTFELSSHYHLTELFFSSLWDSFPFHELSKFFLAFFCIYYSLFLKEPSSKMYPRFSPLSFSSYAPYPWSLLTIVF